MKSTMIYVRVSLDRQEHEDTIQSQLEELRWRVKEDGIVACQEFIDEGHSRDNLIRPALDRFRDLVSQGEVGSVCVQLSPSALAEGSSTGLNRVLWWAAMLPTGTGTSDVLILRGLDWR